MSTRDDRQHVAVGWAGRAFGYEHAHDIAVRRRRFLEEAVELFQALGGDESEGQRVLSHVMARPPGQPFQEAGGVGVTLLVLANAAGFSADWAEATELRRVLSKPLHHFAERNAAKVAAGL